MTLQYLSGNRIQGLSSDTKPSNATANSIFFETDTFKTFDYSGGSWTERSSGGASATDEITIGGQTEQLQYWCM